MTVSTEDSILYWPMLVFAGIALLTVAGMLILSYFLGQRHRESATDDPYESGISTTGSARLRFPAHFYIIAMFFVIFDLEAAFIIAWAVGFQELGWTGYFAMLTFIGILVAVLVYEWRIGALDFAPDGRALLKAYDKLKHSGEKQDKKSEKREETIAAVKE